MDDGRNGLGTRRPPRAALRGRPRLQPALEVRDRGEATEELPELKGEELDAALRRLEEHGLIAAGGRSETIGYFSWWRLRPAPDGWRALGEWPPSSEADMGAALVHILRALAEDAGDEQAKPLRRAAGSVGKLAGNVVFDVAKAELGRAGGGIAP